MYYQIVQREKYVYEREYTPPSDTVMIRHWANLRIKREENHDRRITLQSLPKTKKRALEILSEIRIKIIVENLISNRIKCFIFYVRVRTTKWQSSFTKIVRVFKNMHGILVPFNLIQKYFNEFIRDNTFRE